MIKIKLKKDFSNKHIIIKIHNYVYNLVIYYLNHKKILIHLKLNMMILKSYIKK